MRDIVLFPGVIAPITIARPKSIAAAQQAVREQRPVGIVLQRNPETDDPGPDDLYRIGTIANIVRYITGPDGTHHLICQGVQRFRILDFLPRHAVPGRAGPADSGADHDLAGDRGARSAPAAPGDRGDRAAAAGAAGAGRDVPEHHAPGALADLATSYMDIKPQEKQEILETIDLSLRMEKVSRLSPIGWRCCACRTRSASRPRPRFDERQREALLREQMATIQRQLGEGDGKAAEIAELDGGDRQGQMPPEVGRAGAKELRRCERMPEAAGEYGMVRTYLDWLIELPWALPEEKPIDIAEARRILDEDHFGLEKIKSRIIEYLAVRKLAPQGKAPILCFVGPPGVGKTSLGQSIARAMDRKFVRVSLAACMTRPRSAATGAPISARCPATSSRPISKAGARNCVMMLDEIDKMGRGIQGDPSAAMLEVLDPEQNGTFRDNYLGVPFDLSRVVFIATANMLDHDPRGRCGTAWRSSASPATPRRRSCRSPSAIWSAGSSRPTG